MNLMIIRQKGSVMIKILADTCIWSEVLRRKEPSLTICSTLIELLRNFQVAIIGPIRQEILSGISDEAKFNDLKEKLSFLPDSPIETSDYELAARYSNLCRHKGIQGSSVDFLICAVAVRNEFAIYTVDKDFERYKTVLPITLFGEI